MTNSRKKASDCSGAGKAFPIRQVGAFLRPRIGNFYPTTESEQGSAFGL